jgi:hypothetical protein
MAVRAGDSATERLLSNDLTASNRPTAAVLV